MVYLGEQLTTVKLLSDEPEVQEGSWRVAVSNFN